jgi:hypothetical protein
MIASTTSLTVGKSRGRGRGVFAARRFRAGDVVEVCPVVLVPGSCLSALPSIQQLTFDWGRGKAAVALGFGSLYNHSFEPNARYDMFPESQTIVVSAIRSVQKGQELFVNYNGEPDDASPLWFDVK